MMQCKAVDIQVSGNFRLRWDSGLKIWDLYPDIDDGVLDTTLCDKVGQWQVNGFLWVLLFPSPIKLTTTI